jgi:hypothetical protein
MRAHAFRQFDMSDHSPAPRERRLPCCPICDEQVIAAQQSVLKDDGSYEYLWLCDDCGCGFVTRHLVTGYALV